MHRASPDHILFLISAAVLLAAGAYAAFVPRANPAAQHVPSTRDDDQPRAPDPALPARLDLDAFNIALWIEPPAPEPPKAEPPPPKPTPKAPPPPFDLIAISGSGGVFRATVYHKAENRLITLAPGDRFGPYLVASIDATSLHLEHAGRMVRTDLDQPRIAAVREGGGNE